MKPVRIIAILAAAGSLGACVTPHQEDAKLRMPWPAASEQGLVAYAQPNDRYPTVGGDILRGTAPQVLTDSRLPPPANR
jgi:hypothetical protein